MRETACRIRRGRRHFGTAVAAAFAIAGLAIGGSAAGVAERSSAAAAPRADVLVDAQLVKQLAARPRGVPAVVTTWSRAGLDDVRRLAISGTRLRALPMLLVPRLTARQLAALEAQPSVRSVWANTRLELTMEDTTWITKARYAWAATTPSGGPEGFGVTGKGVELAVIDTGFDGMHEDGDNLIEFCDATAVTSTATSNRSGVFCTPWDPALNPGPAGPCGALDPVAAGCENLGVTPARADSKDEDVSHGTHVGGTVAGTGHASGGTAFSHSTTGMSPHAKLRVYSANIATSLLLFQTLAAYDDMTYKKLQGYSKVVAVNNSWGGQDGASYNPNTPTAVAVRRAWQAGILSVFAAGNSGPEHNTLSIHCVDPHVACIAASTKPDSIVMFSSRGRPSQPTDTNRDGTIDASDVQADNHDWRLGQMLQLGRYRPTLAAPGVNINSMKAIGLNIGSPDAATCREDELITISLDANCYVQANGTSMATPHVTGAVGLIVQAFRQGHRGRTPTPNEILDILERSANVTKLPGWDSEEQGAGRLDAWQAVKFARSYPKGLDAPNLGTPTPPYVAGAYPGPGAVVAGPDPDPQITEKGCTAPGSWTNRQVPLNPGDPVGQPPAPTAFYGQHFVDVPANVDRIRITITWPRHATANLYARIWRPGINPDAPEATPDLPGRTTAFHQARAFPDQEALGLPVGLPPTSRLLEVRAPEESNAGGAPPAVPSGRWILRVYHRAGGIPASCGVTHEQPAMPARAAAYEYNVKLELPRVTHRPSVRIDSPDDGAGIDTRFVEVRGRAGYPPPDAPSVGTTGYSWEGITNWEAPGSQLRTSDEHGDPNPNEPRPVLYFHGNADDACTGDGRTDVLALNGCPRLSSESTLSAEAAASWKGTPVEWAFDGGNDRTVFDPSWTWCLTVHLPQCPATDTPAPGPVTVQGAMTVEWWASCGAACLSGSPEWWLRLWADGVLAFEAQVGPGPALPDVPERLRATVSLPAISAAQRLTLVVEPVFLFDQYLPFLVYYDSEQPCTPISAGRCDSLVRMPVGSSGSAGAGAGPSPENVRVTDLPAGAPYPSAPKTPGLRVAWDPVPDSVRYEVYRSTTPLALGSRVYSGSGTACTSPRAPGDAPAGHDRGGLCFTDGGVQLRRTYYYRVVAVAADGAKSSPSEVAPGTPTRYDRQVSLRADRLYGPQYWEHAVVGSSPNPTEDGAGTSWRAAWDTLELLAGDHAVWARSFTQGIGSAKDGAVYDLEEEREGGKGHKGRHKGCPDDNDGDGRDDWRDGDHDDDGDDEDDDCEDDDDHEEDDDD